MKKGNYFSFGLLVQYAVRQRMSVTWQNFALALEENAHKTCLWKMLWSAKVEEATASMENVQIWLTSARFCGDTNQNQQMMLAFYSSIWEEHLLETVEQTSSLEVSKNVKESKFHILLQAI